MKLKDNEPVLLAAVTTLAPLAGSVALAFGLEWTTEQTAAVVGLVTGVAAVVSAWWARRRVTPNGKVPPAR